VERRVKYVLSQVEKIDQTKISDYSKSDNKQQNRKQGGRGGKEGEERERGRTEGGSSSSSTILQPLPIQRAD
jgi:hypothetical protein